MSSNGGRPSANDLSSSGEPPEDRRGSSSRSMRSSGIGMGRVVGVPPLVVSQVISKVADTDQRETSSRTITDKMVIISENTLNRSK